MQLEIPVKILQLFHFKSRKKNNEDEINKKRTIFSDLYNSFVGKLNEIHMLLSRLDFTKYFFREISRFFTLYYNTAFKMAYLFYSKWKWVNG